MRPKNVPPTSASNDPEADPIEPPPRTDPNGGGREYCILEPVDAAGNATGRLIPTGGSGRVQVSFYIDATLGSDAIAGTIRLEPPSTQFSWPIPAQFRDGKKHLLQADAIDLEVMEGKPPQPMRVPVEGSPRYFAL